MMVGKKLHLLLLVFFLFVLKAAAQDEWMNCWKYNFNTGASSKLFFTASSIKENNRLTTKYDIYSSRKKSKPVYSVKISYNLQAQVIFVYLTDGQSTRAADYLLNAECPLPIVVNNFSTTCDTAISLTGEYRILFTIPEDTSEIILNHFISIDSSSRFTLNDLRNSYLKKHLSNSRTYWQSYRTMGELRHLNILEEEGKIKMKKDSLMENLKKKKNELQSSKTKAGGILQNQFAQKTDSIFFYYLGENDSFFSTVKGKYTVCSKSDGKVEIIQRKFNFPDVPKEKDQWFDDLYKSSNFNKWFKDKIEKIDSNIVHRTHFENESVSLNIDSLFKQLETQHRQRIEKLNLSPDSFILLLFSVHKELKSYAQQIPLPTLYEYEFVYSPKTYKEKWVLSKKKFINSKSKKEIASENLKFIKEKYAKNQNGRYKTRFIASKLNSRQFGPKVVGTRREYKFMSHIGLNIGKPIDQKIDVKFETVDIITNSGELFYIRHYWGIFAGYAQLKVYKFGRSGKQLTRENFLKAGVYFSPINYVYLKAGLEGINPKYTGVMAGVMGVFPFVQIGIERNFAFNLTNIVVGANFPLNQ